VRIQSDSLIPGYRLKILSCHLRVVRYALQPAISQAFYLEWRSLKTLVYWHKSIIANGAFAIAAGSSSIDIVLSRSRRPLATILFFVRSDSASGVPTLNAFNFANANVSHAELLWDSGAKRCPQEKPYEVSFGTSELSHDDNVSQILYDFYEILGRNGSNVDSSSIDMRTWMYGLTLFAFRFTTRPMHTASNEPKTIDGILQVRARFRTPTPFAYNLYALNIVQSAYFYNFDNTVTFSPP